MRSFSRCLKVAAASRKLPMNSIMIGLPKAAKAWLAGAAPITTASAGPSSAVTARGIASLSHSVTTTTRMEVSRRPFSAIPGSGHAYAAAANPTASTSTAARWRGVSTAPPPSSIAGTL